MKPVFLDVDTQNDFMLPAGALYVPGAELLIPAIAKLNHFAMLSGNRLISTTCLHGEDDPEFRIWPPHCIAGTFGQLKPMTTLIGQTMFPKQTTDVFQNARWLPLLNDLQVSEFLVYGVVTEVCVRSAAEGLLRIGAKVTVVRDAVHALSDKASQEFFECFCEAGGRLATIAEVTQG